MKADRQRGGRDGPGKSKLSSLLPWWWWLEGSFMCENVMNIALIANHGQENVLSADNDKNEW